MFILGWDIEVLLIYTVDTSAKIFSKINMELNTSNF